MTSDIESRLRNWYASYHAEVGPADELMAEFLTDVMKAADLFKLAKEVLKRAGHELQDLTYRNVCVGTDAVLREVDEVLAELEK